jgi:hypothetical protein
LWFCDLYLNLTVTGFKEKQAVERIFISIDIYKPYKQRWRTTSDLGPNDEICMKGAPTMAATNVSLEDLFRSFVLFVRVRMKCWTNFGYAAVQKLDADFH